MSNGCSCKDCVSACSHKPGWFLPGEAEKTAALKGMSLRDFFENYLGVDWYEGGDDGDDVFVLAPATVEMMPGKEYPGDPRGTCVFFTEGRCGIHEAKPFECREYIHSEDDKTVQTRHRTVMDKWREEQHKKQIKDLLGREPQSSSYYGGGLFSGLLGL